MKFLFNYSVPIQMAKFQQYILTRTMLTELQDN